MSIQIHNDVLTLETDNSEYQMKKDQYGVLNHLWYGPKTGQSMEFLQEYPDVGFSGSIHDAGADRTYSLDTRLQEYPASGTGDYRIIAASASGPGGTESLDLRVKNYEILKDRPVLEGLPYVRDEQHESETLKITLEDTAGTLQADLYYVVFPREDVIVRHTVFTNLSDQPVVLTQAASASLDLMESQDLDLIHFHGRHARERTMQQVSIPNGITEISSRRTTSSHQHNPGVILAEHAATETSGRAIGMLLMYSGSFAARVEKDQLDQVRLVMGIHPDTFNWTLQPGESFTTPEAILSYSDQGFDRLSSNFHRLINDHVVPSRFQNVPRPVLINNWEATYFDFDDQDILRIGRQASELGIDMLVLDDGWFGQRNSDSEGLGDWDVNEEKLNGPLKKLIEGIHEQGMKFGIWIEPEMISEKSRLYEEHPEWVLKVPGLDPVRSRCQLVLDMANPQVVDFLYGKFSELLKNNPIDYVKWDMNRSVYDLYSSTLPENRQKEVGHRYVLGVYDLLDRLTREFPNVLFEGCSGGGGRFDAGMLFYTPQIWTSDNTDAHERCAIQHGTSFFYPVSTMGSHVSAVPNHQTGRTTSLEARAVVAMAGSFGYEMDLNTLSPEEKDIVKSQVEAYRRLQPLIYQGDYHRLSENQADRSIWSFVSPDKKTVLVLGLLYETRPNWLRQKVRLRGLNPDAQYRLTGDNFIREPGDQVYTGRALMEAGIYLPMTWGTDAPVALMLRQIESAS